MTAAESLAMLVATGVQAEAVVRATVESLDADWRRLLDEANGPNTDGAAQKALVRLEAIAPYRALLGAVVAAWDGPDETDPEVVRIGGVS